MTMNPPSSPQTATTYKLDASTGGTNSLHSLASDGCKVRAIDEQKANATDDKRVAADSQQVNDTRAAVGKAEQTGTRDSLRKEGTNISSSQRREQEQQLVKLLLEEQERKRRKQEEGMLPRKKEIAHSLDDPSLSSSKGCILPATIAALALRNYEIQQVGEQPAPEQRPTPGAGSCPGSSISATAISTGAIQSRQGEQDDDETVSESTTSSSEDDENNANSRYPRYRSTKSLPRERNKRSLSSLYDDERADVSHVARDATSKLSPSGNQQAQQALSSWRMSGNLKKRLISMKHDDDLPSRGHIESVGSITETMDTTDCSSRVPATILLAAATSAYGSEIHTSNQETRHIVFHGGKQRQKLFHRATRLQKDHHRAGATGTEKEQRRLLLTHTRKFADIGGTASSPSKRSAVPRIMAKGEVRERNSHRAKNVNDDQSTQQEPIADHSTNDGDAVEERRSSDHSSPSARSLPPTPDWLVATSSYPQSSTEHSSMIYCSPKQQRFQDPSRRAATSVVPFAARKDHGSADGYQQRDHVGEERSSLHHRVGKGGERGFVGDSIQERGQEHQDVHHPRAFHTTKNHGEDVPGGDTPASEEASVRARRPRRGQTSPPLPPSRTAVQLDDDAHSDSTHSQKQGEVLHQEAARSTFPCANVSSSSASSAGGRHVDSQGRSAALAASTKLPQVRIPPRQRGREYLLRPAGRLLHDTPPAAIAEQSPAAKNATILQPPPLSAVDQARHLLYPSSPRTATRPPLPAAIFPSVVSPSVVQRSELRDHQLTQQLLRGIQGESPLDAGIRMAAASAGLEQQALLEHLLLLERERQQQPPHHHARGGAIPGEGGYLSQLNSILNPYPALHSPGGGPLLERCDIGAGGAAAASLFRSAPIAEAAARLQQHPALPTGDPQAAALLHNHVGDLLRLRGAGTAARIDLGRLSRPSLYAANDLVRQAGGLRGLVNDIGVARAAAVPLDAGRPHSVVSEPGGGGLSAIPASLPVPLLLPEDETKLSAYQLLLRGQIEAFRASPEDVTTHARGRNKPITLRQIGIRCRHCKHIQQNERKKGSVYFPFALVGLYQAAQNMGSSHFHGEGCDQMPPEIRQKFVSILACKSTVGAGKQYWAKAAERIGLVDTDHGIRFVRDMDAWS